MGDRCTDCTVLVLRSSSPKLVRLFSVSCHCWAAWILLEQGIRTYKDIFLFP